MLRPSPNHGTQRLPNDDDDDDILQLSTTFNYNIILMLTYTLNDSTICLKNILNTVGPINRY